MLQDLSKEWERERERERERIPLPCGMTTRWPLDCMCVCPYVDIHVSLSFSLSLSPFVFVAFDLSSTKWPLFFSFCHWTRHLQPRIGNVSKSLRLFSRLDYLNLSLVLSLSPTIVTFTTTAIEAYDRKCVRAIQVVITCSTHTHFLSSIHLAGTFWPSLYSTGRVSFGPSFTPVTFYCNFTLGLHWLIRSPAAMDIWIELFDKGQTTHWTRSCIRLTHASILGTLLSVCLVFMSVVSLLVFFLYSLFLSFSYSWAKQVD